MMAFMKKNKILVVTAILYLITLAVNPTMFVNAVKMTGNFLIEMLEVMPAILIISALITVWIPASVITKNFGKSSGFKGKIISILIGTFSAGPIYAAFPMAKTLLDKGASIGNTVIIVSSWAVIKLPMLLVEIKFLGLNFALTRYLLTVPAILLLGYAMDKIVKRSDTFVVNAVESSEMSEEERILNELPGGNCGACGYGNCANMAKAIAKGKVTLEACPIRGR